MAEICENGFIRKGKPDQVKNICSMVCKHFPEKKNIRSIAARYLDDKYKKWSWSKGKPGNKSNVTKVTFDGNYEQKTKEYKLSEDTRSHMEKDVT